MRTRTAVATLFSAGLALSITVFAQHGPSKGPSPIPATSNVYDSDPAVAPALQIQSDQMGTYGTYDSATGDASIISTATGQDQTHAAGDWWVGPSGTRSIYLDFSQPIPGSAPGGGNPVSLPSGRYSYTSLIGDCDLAGTNLLNMPNGTTASCPLNVLFEYNGGLYRLHMNPGLTSAGTVEYPETNYMTVTCTNGGITHLCSGWTFGPSAGTLGNSTNRTALAQFITKGKTQGEVHLGDYYFSFFFSVTSSQP
jgi:hypothetical protein